MTGRAGSLFGMCHGGSADAGEVGVFTGVVVGGSGGRARLFNMGLAAHTDRGNIKYCSSP